MDNFFDAVKAGIRGARDATGAGRYRAAGLTIACSHCKAEIFERGEAQLNTAGMTLLDLDWLNRSATLLVCTSCGLVHWFTTEPDRLNETAGP